VKILQKYYKMANASGIACDVIVTIGMSKCPLLPFVLFRLRVAHAYWIPLLVLSLRRSRSGMQTSDHVVNLLIMFTVNTNLLTTYVHVCLVNELLEEEAITQLFGTRRML
jgi:hypothetical protein